MAAKKILITGADGFVGTNLRVELGREPDRYQVLCADIDTPPERLSGYLKECEFVVHLAGVNRPKDDSEFAAGNADFTRHVLDTLTEHNNTVPFVMTSSIQAQLDNPYGKSKLAAENAVLDYGKESGADVYIFRLPNVFGKWCRPNYNSAVATFCHNIARELPIQVNDRSSKLTLVYIDDVIDLIKAAIGGGITPRADGHCDVPVTHATDLGYVVDKLYEFSKVRDSLVMPSLEDALDKALYSTFVSYLEPDKFAYTLTKHSDERGLFAEIFKTKGLGQFSVSTTKPGITRGNHWHHSKVEKFVVVSGDALIRFRKIDGDEILEYRVSGSEPTVVDIPPGYTHSIENISETETLVTLIWANEEFDPDDPDTNFLEI